MIRVLVRNENRINALRIFIQCRQAPKSFLAPQPRIHQQASAFRFEQRGVPRAAGSKNGNSKADSPSQAAAVLRGLRRMMTKRRNFVNGNCSQKVTAIRFAVTPADSYRLSRPPQKRGSFSV